MPLAINVYGTRARVARALGVSEAEMLGHVAERLKQRIPTTRFAGDAPRCQEVVIAGDAVDLRKLPFPLWNKGDAGSYITAGLMISRHPEFGWNIAHHRGQIYGPAEVGVCMAPEHHLRLATDEARAEGERVEAAYIIGARPSITIAASSDFALGDYELDVAGALEGRPIEVVRCKTVDVYVPEDLEIVIEGCFPARYGRRGRSSSSPATRPRSSKVPCSTSARSPIARTRSCTGCLPASLRARPIRCGASWKSSRHSTYCGGAFRCSLRCTGRRAWRAIS